MNQEYWLIRDEATNAFIARHPKIEFKDAGEVYEEYRHLPDAFTIDLEIK